MYRKTLLLSILVSLLIHTAVFYTGFFLDFSDPSPQAQEKIVTIEITSPSEPEKLQIVEQISTNHKLNPNAKYLSKNNQSVIEESKASHVGQFKNSALKNHPSSIKKSHPSKQKEIVKNNGDTKSIPSVPQHQEPSHGEVSQTDDYLKDVKKGSATLLNTKEFIYYSYYDRIKKSIQSQWEPRIKNKIIKVFRSGRHIASSQSHITKVRITLDNKGALLKISVLDASGIKELDNAAVEAFRLAAPFLNPPKGMIEPDGTIKIDWSFVLEA